MADLTILDPYGRTMSDSVFRQGRPDYRNAGGTKRFVNIRSSSASGTSAVLGSAEMLRSRVRDVMRNNPWAFQTAEALAANWVGTGIRPESQVEDERLREMIHDLWNESMGEIDAAGVTTGYGIMWQAAKAQIESGECLLRFRPRRLEDGLAVPLQIQILEPDHLPLHKTEINRDTGNEIHGGIEFDALGRRVAYHLLRRHPGDGLTLLRGNAVDTVRIPARDVQHVFIAGRPQQIRSEPWLSRVLLALQDMDDFDDAEMTRKKNAALFGAFITTAEQPQTHDILSGREATEAEQSMDVELEGGSTYYLNEGEDVKFAEPADVGANFDPFVKHQLRRVTAGSGTTYEQTSGDLSDVNFSSIRAGLLEFRRRAQVYIRHWICHQVCTAMWTRWMRAAVLSGALPILNEFARNPRPFLKVRWVPQGWEFVSPVQEADAIIKLLRAGLTSIPNEIIKRGDMTPEQFVREQAAFNELLDSRGLRFTSDPRQEIPR